MKTIGVVDDHQIFREGLVSLLQNQGQHYTVFEFKDGASLLSSEKLSDMDILILDISMPKYSGLDLLKLLQEKGYSGNTVILSMFSEQEYGLQAIELGASAYLSKSIVVSELLQCLSAVEKGSLYISQAMGQVLAQNYKSKGFVPPHDSLSTREKEVLDYLIKGYRSTDIALKLHISIKTVSTYKKRIFDKLNVNSLAELMVYSIEYKLIH